MVIPPVVSWPVGTEAPTSTILNARIRDPLAFLLGRPMAVFRKNAAQLTSHNTPTGMAWQVEDLDTDGGHSNVTLNTRYTAQTEGWYEVSTTLYWQANAVGFRDAWFRVNGDNTRRYGYTSVEIDDASSAKDSHTTSLIYLDVGDYVEAYGLQTSGGTLSVGIDGRDSRFEILWVSA